MTLEISGRVALVTGASRGIGRAIALALFLTVIVFSVHLIANDGQSGIGLVEGI